jgi:serine protease Do
VGVRFRSVEGETISKIHSQLHGGLAVVEVRPDSAALASPAARAGLRPGDILVGMHTWEMVSLDNVRYVLEHPERATFGRGAAGCTIFLLRAGQIHRGLLPLPY